MAGVNSGLPHAHPGIDHHREIERVLYDEDGDLYLSLLAHIGSVWRVSVTLQGEYNVRRDLVAARLR